MPGPRAARRVASRLAMPFWKMTPPMTTEIAVERLRTKPKVAVAVAMSFGSTSVCRAMSGAWKLGPTPMPAMSWKIMTRALLRIQSQREILEQSGSRSNDTSPMGLLLLIYVIRPMDAWDWG